MNKRLRDLGFTENNLINKKLGILADWNYDNENDLYYDVHFYDSKGYEFEAYVMDDGIENFQDEIENNFNVLKSVNTFDELVERYFKFCGRDIILDTSKFEDKSDDAPILNFKGHLLQMFY